MQKYEKEKKYMDTWISKKKKKKIWTLERPKVLLKKDEHMKAHIYKKRKRK